MEPQTVGAASPSPPRDQVSTHTGPSAADHTLHCGWTGLLLLAQAPSDPSTPSLPLCSPVRPTQQATSRLTSTPSPVPPTSVLPSPTQGSAFQKLLTPHPQTGYCFSCVPLSPSFVPCSRLRFLPASESLTPNTFCEVCRCLVVKSHLTPHSPMDCSTPGLPVCHDLLELTQTHVH